MALSFDSKQDDFDGLELLDLCHRRTRLHRLPVVSLKLRFG